MYLLLLAVGWQTLPHRVRRTQRSPLCAPWKEEYPAPQSAAEQFSGLNVCLIIQNSYGSLTAGFDPSLAHHFPKTV
ncbi:hypothetical protein BDV32DRAFT_133709 [Aspergillus pseudonomiae]|uniref:Uncharacterized protein n=1 Tax=Aspergillus pseudonomiae TaxID=1506151 RepID=A0A5N7CWY2_9EURO|nr:uncharacterized protein BDV37DRAFT_262792 [Aspergillus pseudonomiae]KAB8253666.1 hypothetical protein BDV32DRAFT_133709 [Aspergillus pseudonomiae]KAE8398690.1 hypothetical protein BDV37DRAFT_262792 [Aspergillus pseudonomiae]